MLPTRDHTDLSSILESVGLSSPPRWNASCPAARHAEGLRAGAPDGGCGVFRAGGTDRAINDPSSGSCSSHSNSISVARDREWPVYAAENGLPIPKVQVQVVGGVNTGRSTFSEDGNYQLADLEPATFTLQFTTSEYRDLQRTEVIQSNTTLHVQLERKGLTLSGRITTQWGEPIHAAGVEARSNGGARGGGTSYSGDGMYRIPTLPPADYIVTVSKWGYVTPQRTVTMTGDTTLDFVLDRVRVSLFGTVSEAPPCSGAIQGAEVEVVSGPDVGIGVVTTATGYRTDRRINWGTFRDRATKVGPIARTRPHRAK